jgi:hypothetical protein
LLDAVCEVSYNLSVGTILDVGSHELTGTLKPTSSLGVYMLAGVLIRSMWTV